MKHIRVKISHDDSCNSPRDNDSPIKLALFTRNYDLSNEINFKSENNSLEEDLELLQSQHKYACVVYGYSHSGIAFSTKPSAYRWDSGVAGFAVSDDDFIESEERFLEFVSADLNEYSDWLNGNCYGYEVEVNGEHVDSCWGFIGDWDKSDILNDIKNVLEYELPSTRPDIVTELMEEISSSKEIDHAYERWFEDETAQCNPVLPSSIDWLADELINYAVTHLGEGSDDWEHYAREMVEKARGMYHAEMNAIRLL